MIAPERPINKLSPSFKTLSYMTTIDNFVYMNPLRSLNFLLSILIKKNTLSVTFIFLSFGGSEYIT